MIYDCYLRAKCKKLFSALKTKVWNSFVYDFVLVKLTVATLFSLVFLLCFFYLTKLVRIKPILFV